MTSFLPVNHRRGFTLIELLLSIVICSVVLAAINAVLYGSLRLRNKTARLFDHSLPIQQAAATLRRDFANLVVPGGTLSGTLKTGSMTTPGVNADSGIEIFTSSGSMSDFEPWGDIQKVTYSLRDPEIRGVTPAKDLVRWVTRNLLTDVQLQPEAEVLLTGVEKIEFLFFDGSQWRTSWDSTTEQTIMPTAVRINLTLADEDQSESPRGVSRAVAQGFQLIVPVLATANTNQIAQAQTGGG